MHRFCDIFLQAPGRANLPATIRDYTFFSTSAHDSMGDTLTSREKKLLPHIGLLLALHRAQKEVERLQAENLRMAEENRLLQQEVKRLESDPAYLEDKARKEYGLLKENELLYIFKKK